MLDCSQSEARPHTGGPPLRPGGKPWNLSLALAGLCVIVAIIPLAVTHRALLPVAVILIGLAVLAPLLG